MNSVADIWNSVLETLGRDMTPTSVSTWFADCVPVELCDNKLVVHTPTEFKRGIIMKRFYNSIRGALSDIFSCDFDLLVLAGEELEEYKSEKESDDSLPEVAGYTFDRFIVGSSNKYAHAAAIAVSENLGKAYNPLFIYGNSGLGKTHLLLSIGQAVHEKNAAMRIAYIKGDDFTNQMVRSIREGTAEEFRTRYRNVDLFLVDDIQFIAGKQQTQEEFFHTFNNIYEAGHQIVITSDRPPMEMVKLDDRLRTRFEGGLMADVQPPDLETRMAITRNKAAQLALVLPDDVVEYISESLTSNIRQIEGTVKRLTAYRDLEGSVINVDTVKRAIKDVIRTGEYIPTPETIIEATARYYSLTADDLRGERRLKNTTTARQVSMYLMRSLTNMALSDIGKEYGRNHSTVIISVRKIEDMLRTDPDMAGAVRDITSNINSRN